MRAIAGAFRAAAREKRLELFVDVSAATPPLVCIDAIAVSRILYTLIANAIAHTHHGGIRLRLRVAQGDAPASVRLELMVADTGVGLSRAQIALIYAAAEEYGAGGVADCVRWARALGGTLTAQSELGEGALFRLSLSAVVAGRDPGRLGPQEAAQPAL
jgi:signal transduction histidine kinase